MMHELDSARMREHHLATHHPLTELPNRYLFYDRLAQALASAKRNSNCVAVLYLDLDRFKAINDTLGHGTGDAVLQEVARRLCLAVRSSDPNAAMITSAIIALANNLNLEIVAEGVEEPGQCEFLLERGAPIMQGYLFSPPLSADDFEALVRRGAIPLDKES